MSDRKKALIIDDEEGLLSILTMFLEDNEFECEAFESIDLFLEKSSIEKLPSFDYMIVDHNLPGTKGLDFVIDLAPENCPRNIVLTSGELLNDDRLKERKEIIVLLKPFDFSALEKLFI